MKKIGIADKILIPNVVVLGNLSMVNSALQKDLFQSSNASKSDRDQQFQADVLIH